MSVCVCVCVCVRVRACVCMHVCVWIYAQKFSGVFLCFYLKPFLRNHFLTKAHAHTHIRHTHTHTGNNVDLLTDSTVL